MSSFTSSDAANCPLTYTLENDDSGWTTTLIAPVTNADLTALTFDLYTADIAFDDTTMDFRLTASNTEVSDSITFTITFSNHCTIDVLTAPTLAN